ncbi:MAG: DUF3467 domain-containing protein [Deltaproteobacteria bacterium]
MAEEREEKKTKRRRLDIQSEPEVSSGVYSNLMLVSHRKEEFVLDFLFVEPQGSGASGQKARLRSRVITSPEHVKRIMRALEENVGRYESRFGSIEEATDLSRVVH